MLTDLMRLLILIFVFYLPLGQNRKISGPNVREMGKSRRTVGAPEGFGDQYRYLVLIVSKLKNQTHVAVSRCTGTIIRPSIILTAGHCVNYEPEFKFTLFDVSVYPLSCSKIAVSECPKIHVDAFVSYGDLTHTSVKFDIALLFVRPKLSITTQLPRLCENLKAAFEHHQQFYMSTFSTPE